MWYEEGENEGLESFGEKKYFDAGESNMMWEMGSLCLCSSTKCLSLLKSSMGDGEA